MESLEVRTERREQMLDVTRRIAEAVSSAGISEGWAAVWCPHTTAAVTVNENADPDVPADILDWLGAQSPREGRWRHREGNADAHVKAVLVGPSVTIPITGGRLALGTWQGVFFCEFDGPRNRSLQVTVVGQQGRDLP
jgi:secondary thiamine-phosphate synthase enzyme